MTTGLKLPYYCQASGVAYSLAHLIFEAAETAAKSKDARSALRSDPLFEHWFNLRTIAGRFSSQGHTALDVKEREMLHGALRAAHECEHFGALSRSADRCDCPPAALIRRLKQIFIDAGTAESWDERTLAGRAVAFYDRATEAQA